MKLDANNNRRIIYRIAKSNLMGKKLYSFFSFLSIILSVSFVGTVILFLQGTQTAEKRMLDGMQHVMFLNVSEGQMEEISADRRADVMVPYKDSGEVFQIDDVKYKFLYMGSQTDKIQTYRLSEGKEPEKYNEVAVNKHFMDNIGRECKIGGTIVLDAGGTQEEFIVCGITDNQYGVSVSPVYVSREFAGKSALMKETGYTALVQIAGAPDMESSAFETSVYQMAVDYGIKRIDVNINGRFEEALQGKNTAVYAIIFVSLFILAASAIVVYSIFYLSVTSRTKQIGQLQTIGMTQKQIKKMVRREGFILSAVSVPLGLFFGGVTAYFLEPEGWDFLNYIITAAIVGIFGIVIVQISVGKPASLAAKVSPVEAAGSLYCGEKEKGCTNGHKRLTAFVLAKICQGKSGKKRKLLTISLAFGGVVFMVASSYLYAWDEFAYSRAGGFEDAEYRISYLYNAHNPSAYGPTEMQLTGHLDGNLKKELMDIPYVESIKVINSVYGSIEFQGATWVEGFGQLTEDSKEYFDMEMDGNNSYGYLSEHDGIIITDSGLSSEINGVTFKPGDKLTLRWFDGKEHSAQLEIAAITSDVMGENEFNFYMTDKTIRKLWGDMNTASSFLISSSEYEKHGEQIEQEVRAMIGKYPDLSLATLREKIVDDAANIQKIKIQIYGISAFLILFSILNLINMMIGNFAVRKKELSMLESVGMEEKQIRDMLFWESIQMVFPALLFTLVIGSAAGYGFVFFLQKTASYMAYRFPAVPCILYIAGVAGIPLVISFIGLKGQNRVSLSERIKYVD
ncbi:ABC transporter permease [bacterium D16-51]|nr:ABC transporter permease [bacterium D16-59]RKI57467.1 ABC transporter permease [bacterium D16-51]